MKEEVALALGFFDGVHRGHGALLERVKAHSAQSAVFTFDCHPGTLLGTKSSSLLSSVEDRAWLIENNYGISKMVVAPFSAIQQMPWMTFVTEYLKEELCVTHVVAGHDFRFGRGGMGTAQRLQELCPQLGMTCDIVPPVKLDEVVISSTHIRALIQNGEMEKATSFLGHPHILSNEVEHGNQIGSQILGFPTVNLSIPEDVIVPFFGVYACRIWVGERVFHAVANVGIRPTVEEPEKKVRVEAFLLDFPEETLYGKTLRIEFHAHLRGEIAFENFMALSQQIGRDVQSTRDFFA
ncbi:MAG: riboflavin biosynthesis protein RibF [Eubacteriales bacterium]